nr:RNA-binding protein 48 isoform X1 [Ipomoea batatas]
MPRYRDETPAVCVYTVCDESKFLIVRNVPALGCGDDLAKLFTTYGEVEEFAKRKLDEFVFLGNRLQVSYAPQYESLSDTKEKLEGRRREVLTRVNSQRSKSSAIHGPDAVSKSIITSTSSHITSKPLEINKSPFMKPQETANNRDSSTIVISSNKEYFSSESMNQTVQLVREKLNKIQSSAEHSEAGASKKVNLLRFHSILFDIGMAVNKQTFLHVYADFTAAWYNLTGSHKSLKDFGHLILLLP